MKISEQVAALEAARAAKAAQLETVVEKSMDAGRSMDEAEQVEFDEIESEVKSIDEDLARLRKLEQIKAKSAAPVAGDSVKAAAESRTHGPAIIVKREADEKFQGQNYTRMVIAKTLAHLDGVSPIAIAQKRWGQSNPMLVDVIKADVEGGATTADSWGAELATADSRYMGDFIEFLYGRTVYNQLPLREIPANVVIKGQDGAATGYWVGESKGIPVTAMDFNDVELRYLKVAALSVISNELIRESSPAAEMLVRDALVNAAAQRIDTTFLSNAAAVAGVSPAGLLNGVTGKTSAGTDADGVRADIRQLYGDFLTAKNATGVSLVMNPAMAKTISLMVNALGQTEFPGLTTAGGTLVGDPVYTGDNVNAAHLIALKPSDIYRIGASGVQVSVSRDATIEMADNPAQDSQEPVAATGKVVGMFQTESTAIKVVVPMNFAKRRAHVVQFVGNAAYALT